MLPTLFVVPAAWCHTKLAITNTILAARVT
jgi:hypothetical protein